MAKKVILDVDPGIDDALSLCIALFDPRLEVLAVTAVGGNVAPQVATRNVQAIIEYLDPPRLPRIGAACKPDDALPVDGRYLFGVDGLGGAGFQVAELRDPHPADKVICDTLRSAPGEVTIIALGPLTNVARALQRDADLARQIGELVIMGGAVDGVGNITPAAEFNVFCDPESARAVFRSRSTKTLIPLDVTNRIVLSYDLFNQIPDDTTRVGRFLQKILPPAFRAYRQQYGLEGIHAHDTIALMAAINRALFTTNEMAGDVEVGGELTRGATVFDRRRRPEWRKNMEVAVDMDINGIVQQIVGCMIEADRRAR